MEVSHTEMVRASRESMRQNIKSKLKITQIKETIAKNESEDNQLQQVELDKRKFSNVFRLEEKIGEGAHGVVRKCVQINTGQIYAVKISNGDEELISISKRTFHILKLLDHDCIIKAKYLFIDETTENIFLVMEHCTYMSLTQNTLGYIEIKILIKKLLETMLYVHRNGICHRDLKPDNILYDPVSNSLKVIDFGVSKRIYNRKKYLKQKMWTVTGTIYYKAPEMFLGGEYDQLIDVWAIGIITYQLVYKILPFNSDYTGEIIDKIIEQEPQYYSLDIAEQSLAIDFIKALLRKNPKQRINCAQALRHPWFENTQAIIKDKRFASQDFTGQQMFFNRQKQFSVFEIDKLSPCSITNPKENSKTNDQKENPFMMYFQSDIIEILKDVNGGKFHKSSESFSSGSVGDAEKIQKIQQQSQSKPLSENSPQLLFKKSSFKI